MNPFEINQNDLNNPFLDINIKRTSKPIGNNRDSLNPFLDNIPTPTTNTPNKSKGDENNPFLDSATTTPEQKNLIISNKQNNINKKVDAVLKEESSFSNLNTKPLNSLNNNDNNNSNPFLDDNQPNVESIPKPIKEVKKQVTEDDNNPFLTYEKKDIPPQIKENDQQINNQPNVESIPKPIKEVKKQVKEDDNNPFLEEQPTQTNINNNNNNNNNSPPNTFVLLNQIQNQKDEFDKKEKYLQDKLSQIIKDKNDIESTLTSLNEKYMEVLRQNEELKQTKSFIKENIQLFVKESNNEGDDSPKLNQSSDNSKIYHFNFAHEIKQLHKYKSLEDISFLLKNTMKTLNNDNILMVCHFIYDTLRERLFLNEISKYPNLIDLFFGYLRRLGKFNDVIQLQKHLKIIHEEIYISLFMAFNEKDYRKKKQLLFNWASQYKGISQQASNQQYGQYVSHIEHYCGLLDRQIRIEEFDSQQAMKGDPIYIKYPRSVLIDRSMNDTLYYMHLYHPTASKDKLSSPLSLKESFEISEKLVLLNQLKARSFIQDWNSVKDILPKKKGIFTKTYQCEIGIEGFTEILMLNDAPYEMVELCIRMLDDEQKYNFSMQNSLFSLALEALLNLKSLRKSNEFKMTIEKQITSNPSLLSLIETLNQAHLKQKNWK